MGDSTLPWGLWLMVIQAVVIAIVLVVSFVQVRWRFGGALARGARYFYAGMALFALGHVSAFLLSLYAPQVPAGALFALHHGGALVAVTCITIGFGRTRSLLRRGPTYGALAYLTWTLPIIAGILVVLSLLVGGLPVPGAPDAGMMGGVADMGMGMGGTDAMRELSSGVTLAHVTLDCAVLCVGMTALALGSALQVSGAIGRALRLSLMSLAALVVIYPMTTITAAFRPELAAWLEMGLCFTVTCAFATFAGGIAALRTAGLALQSPAVPLPAHVRMRAL